jgi:hypothetical protein
MPRLKPQAQFLLRGSALLIALLSLWWFGLMRPMVAALEVAAGSVLHIEETASGDWSMRVPLEMTLPASPERPVAQQVHSIDFDMLHSDVIAFTFSLPVFWAIVLAAPGWRGNLRPLVIGSVVMAIVEVLLFLLYAQVAAHRAAAQLAPESQGPWSRWAIQFGEYLTVNVLPYALPLIVAFAVHRELRWLVFRWGAESVPVALNPTVPPGKKRRDKR